MYMRGTFTERPDKTFVHLNAGAVEDDSNVCIKKMLSGHFQVLTDK